MTEKPKPDLRDLLLGGVALPLSPPLLPMPAGPAGRIVKRLYDGQGDLFAFLDRVGAALTALEKADPKARTAALREVRMELAAVVAEHRSALADWPPAIRALAESGR
jgi:hypothetical protein